MPWTFASLLLVNAVFVYSINRDLYEGNRCTLENGSTGICKKLPECPSRIQEVMQGIRTANSTGRCGFDGFIEVVCCPMGTLTTLRTAEVACERYQTMNVTHVSMEDALPIGHDLVAKRYEFPFAAALGYRDEDTREIIYGCGGSLITMRHVLTSAQCANNGNMGAPVVVMLGSTYLQSTSSGVQRHRIIDVTIHPRYNSNEKYNNVAILKLEASIKFTAQIRPVCLHTKPVNVPSNADSIVVGWGSGNPIYINKEWLMKTPPLSLINRDTCNDSRRLPYGRVDDTMICTFLPYADTPLHECDQDAGGSLIMYVDNDPYLIGITAFGELCNGSVPAVHTALYPYLDWIEEVALLNNKGNNIW